VVFKIYKSIYKIEYTLSSEKLYEQGFLKQIKVPEIQLWLITDKATDQPRNMLFLLNRKITGSLVFLLVLNERIRERLKQKAGREKYIKTKLVLKKISSFLFSSYKYYNSRILQQKKE
jgi:hypothetical protein